MSVHILSRHQNINSRLCKKHIHKITSILLNRLNLSHCNVSVLVTDDTEIHGLNLQYRKKDSATNVLSFPFADENDKNISAIESNELGDIIISLETAAREASHYNLHLFERLNWLVTHGLLHLIGYDHELSDKDARKMADKESELLKYLSHNRSNTMPQLAINVDHVATVRQARGGIEPDPVTAAAICELAGVSGIVIHLREDRRHIQDRDVYLLRKTVKTKLNLEMGANKEIIDIALDVVPDMITLVPEKREELTTEGGLDVVSQKKKLAKVIKKFSKAGIPTSIFIDPDSDQIKASYDIGAKFIEIHTGRYCDATTEELREKEFALITAAADEAYNLGLIVNAGHGLDYNNTGRIAALDSIDELSIGHAVISRSIFTGLEKAVTDMLNIIQKAQLQLF